MNAVKHTQRLRLLVHKHWRNKTSLPAAGKDREGCVTHCRPQRCVIRYSSDKKFPMVESVTGITTNYYILQTTYLLK